MNDQPPSPPDHSEDDWKRYVASGHIRPGAVCVIRHTQGGFWRFELDEIEAVDQPRKGRIYTRQNSSFFRRSAKKCRYPTGKTSMAPLTPEIVRAALNGYVWHYARPSPAWPLPSNHAELAQRLEQQLELGVDH